jgi:superfamily II DNA or RNA helicase
VKLEKSMLTLEQQKAITRLFEHNQTLLVAGLGFGKAIVGLTALQELHEAGVFKRAVVLAPLRVATSTWACEVDKWSHLKPGLIAVACGGEAQRQKALASDAPVIVINFESAAQLIEEAGEGYFDAMLIDELTKLKSTGGTLFKLLRRWVKTLVWRAGMTATPVAEFGGDIYGQALLLDDGKALGTRKDAFMQEFCTPLDFKGYNWAMRPGAQEKIGAKLAALLYRAEDTSYLESLPELVDMFVPVPLTAAARLVYTTMQKDSVYEDVEAPNEAVKAGKLAQVAAGGLYQNDDDERTLYWRDVTQARLAAVQEFVGSLGEPVIITYSYGFQLDLLIEAWPDAPVLGGKGRATNKDIEAFNRGEVPVLIGHPKSMGMGLNLQSACRTLVHLSPLYSADLYKQTIGRIHRRGQTKPCTRISFYSPDTVEDRIILSLGRKAADEKDFMAAL